MASRKGKKAEPTPPAQSSESKKAAREKDNEAQPHVYRVDLGESIPDQPLKTATDNE